MFQRDEKTRVSSKVFKENETMDAVEISNKAGNEMLLSPWFSLMLMFQLTVANLGKVRFVRAAFEEILIPCVIAWRFGRSNITKSWLPTNTARPEKETIARLKV